MFDMPISEFRKCLNQAIKFRNVLALENLQKRSPQEWNETFEEIIVLVRRFNHVEKNLSLLVHLETM